MGITLPNVPAQAYVARVRRAKFKNRDVEIRYLLIEDLKPNLRFRPPGAETGQICTSNCQLDRHVTCRRGA